MALTETAYAKVNLALHVRKRRDDGYHELETLFAFVDAGDWLEAEEARLDKLNVQGEFAQQLTDLNDNIVMRALAALPRPEGLAVTLEKRLPVAAGLGGGSADAGALFRLVERSHGLPDDWQERAARLGADVPACVKSRTCVGRGTGIDLEIISDDISKTPILIVNPRIPLFTAAVFRGWGGVDRGALPEGPASTIAAEGRNDLEASALTLCPVIGDVLAALRQTEACVVRMSGSGASCFALFSCHDVMLEAASYIHSNYPQWWQMSGSLR